jgi:hypothetical protein
MCRDSPNIACVEGVHKHLIDAGQLVFDVFNPSLQHLAGKEDVADLLGPAGRRAGVVDSCQ